MRILFLTNLLPYPLDNGGKIKTYNTLKMMSEGNKIDIFSFYETDKEKENIEYMKKEFNLVNAIYKPLTTSKHLVKMVMIGLRSLVNDKPFVLLKFVDKNMKQLLIESIKKNKYDLVYIDHLQLAVYMDILKEANCPIYLDQHNCESQIIKRKSEVTKSLIKRTIINMEYKKLKKFEDMIISCVDKVIVLSEEDKKCLVKGLKIDREKFIVIPIPIEADYKKKNGVQNQEVMKIMFLGTLSWFPNAQGIEWFVENVVTALEKHNFKYKLYIVGKDPSENLINKCNENSNIEITGYVNDVNEYIEKCDILVSPIFVGSGMRVKILECIGKRMPVISTTIGAEGIEVENNKSILIANTTEEFVKAIYNIRSNDMYINLQIEGELLFNKKYSLNAIKAIYRKKVLKEED